MRQQPASEQQDRQDDGGADHDLTARELKIAHILSVPMETARQGDEFVPKRRPSSRRAEATR